MYSNQQFAVFSFLTYFSIVVWLIQLSHTIALIFGIILALPKNSLKDGILSVVTIDAFFAYASLYTQEVDKGNDPEDERYLAKHGRK